MTVMEQTRERVQRATVAAPRRYALSSLILLFFCFSIGGWIWEVFYVSALEGQMANRGFLHGPWLPIYGVGGVLLLLGMRPLMRRPALVFISGVTLCGAVEYVASWALERWFHVVWWQYGDAMFNLNGRICLSSLIAFGAVGLLTLYVLAPRMHRQFQRMPRAARLTLCVVLCVIFAADLGVSLLIQPNMGPGITELPLLPPG